MTRRPHEFSNPSDTKEEYGRMADHPAPYRVRLELLTVKTPISDRNRTTSLETGVGLVSSGPMANSLDREE
jgi:hypothetical protein